MMWLAKRKGGKVVGSCQESEKRETISCCSACEDCAPSAVAPWDVRLLSHMAMACVAFSLVTALVVLMFAVVPVLDVPAAWADEAAEGDNAVDVTQLPDSSFIYDTSITDLSTADAYYDKQTVQVTGEVVGDRIDAGDDHHCWITLASASDASTVSVYMTNESASKIDLYGAYDRKGTTLQVRGTFQLACSTHDGVSDLHAQVVSVTEKGKATPDEFEFEAFIPGLVTIMIGLVMMAVFYLLRERQR